MGTVTRLRHMPEQLTHVSADAFKAGMRRLASGVALITSADADGRGGLIATAISSVSTAPPTLLACVNRDASAHSMINQSGRLCINLLREADLDLVRIFSQSSRRQERFQTGEWGTLTTGAPVLQSALVAFDCEVVQRLTYESHSIFLGVVREVHLPDQPHDPLLYMDSAFRRLAEVA